MSRNSAASMFGGAGGRDSRASVGNLDVLRNIMRYNPENSPAAAAVAPAAPSAAPTAPPANPDDKKTMQGLNERLSGYLTKVHKLESENKALEEKIEEILAKRSAPDGRNWDEIKKPLTDLKKKLNDMTMENARMLLQIDNNKLANGDFKNKLDIETHARRTVEHDVNHLRKIIDDSQLTRMDLESHIESVKEELALLKKEHKDEVEALRTKIRDSSVTVQVDSPESNLSETISKIRGQYEKLAEKNLKETDDWYQSKFDNIRVEVVQNTEVVQTGKSEMTELRHKRKQLEVDIRAMKSMIRSLEEALMNIHARSNDELARLNHILMGLEAELTQVRARLEHQGHKYEDLLTVKMKLEAEISKYKQLIGTVCSEDDSMEISLKEALNSEAKGSDKMAAGEKGVIVQSEAPPPKDGSGDAVQAGAVAPGNNAAPKATTKS